jgi:hypothetical protein
MERTLTRPRPAVRDEARLRAAAVFFTVAVLLHNSDHLRRGLDATPRDVFWLGTLAIFIEVGVVVVVFMRHRLAPAAAVAVGLQLALGYVVVHFTPHRSWISDSFVSGGDVSPLSILAAGLETFAALTLAFAGLSMVLRGEAEPGPSRSLADTVRHPVVAIMAVGNAAILVLSFVWR